MLRGLGHDEADVVEALPPRPPRDLVEVARGEDGRLLPVELAQAREEHGPYRDVDADPEGVGAADDLEQARLRELLDEHAVLGQEARVVDPDALLQPLADVGAVGAGEAEPGDGGPDRVLLLASAEVEAREVLGAVRGVSLGEVHDVDGCLALRDELVEGLGERDLRVGVLERHRPLARFHDGGGPAGAPREVLGEERHVAEGGGHQEEPRPGEGEERHLPGDAAVPVGVPVELVHDDVVHPGVLALAQGDVRQHLGGAAQDRRVAVDGRVPRREPDVLRPELAAQGHPLLVDQRLDRAGVDGPPPVGERGEVERGGDERLPGAGRGVQDDVPALEELEDRLLLRRVEGEALAGDVVEEAPEQLVGARFVFGGQELVEGAGHRPAIVGQVGVFS